MLELEDVMLMKELKNLKEQDRLVFMNEMSNRRKNSTTGVLLALFLGGLGAHRFYMGQTGLGILYLCFVWTFVPGIVAFVEAFLMPQRVRAYNAAVGMEIMTKIRVLQPGSAELSQPGSLRGAAGALAGNAPALDGGSRPAESAAVNTEEE